MKLTKNILLAVIFLTLLVSCSKQETADTIYKNGKIYTVNEAQPWAEAVAIKDGKFIKVGSDTDVETLVGENTEVIDLEGKFVMPGIVDIHAHAMEGGGSNSLTWKLPSSADNPTWEEMDRQIREAKKDMKLGKEWFVGYNMTKTVFPEGKYHKSYFDEIFGDIPVFIYLEGQHEAITNTKGLELAGLDKNTIDPPAGVFQRESATGELTGGMNENSAFDQVYDLIPVATNEERNAAYKQGIEQLIASGVTAFMEAWSTEEELSIISNWIADWDMPIHGKLSIEAIGYGDEDAALDGAQVIAMFDKYNVPKHMRFAKVRADGDITGFTGYMLESYTNRKDYTGALPLPEEIWKKIIRDLDKHDIQVKIHAIGDGAVRASLDIFEELIKKRGSNELRHHIDHLNVIHPDDIQRFQKAGIPASPLSVLAQPWPFTMLHKAYLGEDRFENDFLPVGRIWNTGAHISYHSDWDASPVINHFFNAQLLVTRRIPGQEEKGMLSREEDRLTVEQVLQAMTINGAYVMKLDDVTGSIETGKYADMIVLNHNLLEIPETDIHKTKVLSTIFKGNKGHQAN